MTSGDSLLQSNSTALILMYHRVAEAHADPFSLAVSRCHFAEHLEILQAHAHPMRMPGLLAALAAGTMPPRPVVLTFDDGYADNLHQALPLLERFGVPATVFVSTGFLDSPREMWWDELERIFLE